jgi:hypothetical protein
MKIPELQIAYNKIMEVMINLVRAAKIDAAHEYRQISTVIRVFESIETDHLSIIIHGIPNIKKCLLRFPDLKFYTKIPKIGYKGADKFTTDCWKHDRSMRHEFIIWKRVTGLMEFDNERANTESNTTNDMQECK